MHSNMTITERFIVISLLVSSLIMTSAVHAQNSPGYSNDTSNPGTGGNAVTTTPGTTGDNFSWWWLLPLVLIPLVLLIPWGEADESTLREEEYRTSDMGVAYRGVKGGRRTVSKVEKDTVSKKSPRRNQKES